MYQTLKSIVLPFVFVITVGFAVILLNQTLQLAVLASQVHPLAGTIVLVAVLAVFAIGIGYPMYAYLRLPEPLIPPAETQGTEYEIYRKRLAKRLASNPHLQPVPAKGLDLDEALQKLDRIAEQRTRDFASKVFLGTAISQNGSIDSLLVLAAQGRLVYEIACVYHQRPHLRELVYLYTNVAATAFIAGELEDIDVGEQIQPIVTAILGTSVSAIPGMSAAAGLFVSSVVTGTFLRANTAGYTRAQIAAAAVGTPQSRRSRFSASSSATARQPWPPQYGLAQRSFLATFSTRSLGLGVLARQPPTERQVNAHLTHARLPPAQPLRGATSWREQAIARRAIDPRTTAFDRLETVEPPGRPHSPHPDPASAPPRIAEGHHRPTRKHAMPRNTLAFTRTTLAATLSHSTHAAQQSCAEHAAIEEALEAGDLALARQRMLDHIGHVEHALSAEVPTREDRLRRASRRRTEPDGRRS